MSEPQQSDHSHQPEPTTYQWTNKHQFQHSNLSEEATTLLTKTSEGGEEQNVINLFSKLMRHSSIGLVYFNDHTKEMNLYNTPLSISVMNMSNRTISYTTSYDDIRNRFNYIFNVGYTLGGKGASFNVSAFRNRSFFKYSFGYGKLLWERIDKCYLSNTDQLSFHVFSNELSFANSLELILARESRQNYIDFQDSKAKDTIKFGQEQSEKNLPKHSNLLSLQYHYIYAPFVVSGKLGVDFGNGSIFKTINLSISKMFSLGNSFNLNTTATFANMWGRNILKNDMFFRNLETWSDRTKNYISPRVELQFSNFPYLSIFKLIPHLYTQFWASFRPGKDRLLDTKLQGQYGVGISSADRKLRFDISLFRCSIERKGPIFGTLKFSF